jgi:RimJ/RimL family protein N-acetyltransferase
LTWRLAATAITPSSPRSWHLSTHQLPELIARTLDSFWRGIRGVRLMTVAHQAVAHHVLQQPEIYRIGAVCDGDNIASARVLEKAGMQREGMLRRFIRHPNVSEQPRDVFPMQRFVKRDSQNSA